VEGHGIFRSASVVQELIQVIQKHIICGVTVGIDGAAFRQLFATEKTSPEEFLFYRIMRRTIARCLIPNWQGMLPLHLVFDDPEHSMRFYSAYRQIKSRMREVRDAVCSIAFADDRFVGALHAADLLACATVREHRRDVDAWDDDSPFRGLLQAKDPVYGQLYEQEYWDEDEILKNKSEIIKMAATIIMIVARWVSGEEYSAPHCRTLQRYHLPQLRGRIPGSARIALYHQSCGSAVSWTSSASNSSSS
jgi:hypothetical protein